MINFKSIFIVLILFVICTPAMATTVTELKWSTILPYGVTATDTTQYGNYVYAGLANGSIYQYDLDGNFKWSYHTKGNIKKIISSADGDIVWINSAGEYGYLDVNGVSLSQFYHAGINVTDISMSKIGNYVVTEATPANIYYYDKNGILLGSNVSFTDKLWTGVVFDPFSTWFVTSNQSSNYLHLWNITTFNGWTIFNPTNNSAKTADQINIDNFSYRSNFSVNDYNTSNNEFIFTDTSAVTYIEKVGVSSFQYNSANTGKYFYWTVTGNISADQSTLVPTSRCSGGVYTVILKHGYTNYTAYYGNTGYNYTA